MSHLKDATMNSIKNKIYNPICEHLNFSDKTSNPVSSIANKSLTAKSTPCKQEDKPFWTSEKKVLAISTGIIVLTAIALYKFFLKNNENVDSKAANCIENWEYDARGSLKGMNKICCAKNHPGPSPECQLTKERFRQGILTKNPRATFSYSEIKYSKDLSPIAQDIESSLKTLAQMSDTDPEMNHLKKNIAKKLFVELPNYCNSKPLPKSAEHFRSKIFAKDLDYMYERNPNLLSEKILKSLWYQFSLLFHPDKGGDEATFVQGASVNELVGKCLKHLAGGNPSCRWMELKPIENFKLDPLKISTE